MIVMPLLREGYDNTTQKRYRKIERFASAPPTLIQARKRPYIIDSIRPFAR